MEVPYRVMEEAHQSMKLLAAMAREGVPSSASDAGVGALCARAAVRGAFLNVRINADGLEDKVFAGDLIKRGRRLDEEAATREKEILAVVESRLE